jgi:hypothetical protein
MKIVIVSTDRGFEVRVIDDQGLTIRKFTQCPAGAASGRCVVNSVRQLPGDRSDGRAETLMHQARFASHGIFDDHL